MKALIEGTVARFGRLDCLFGNAGSGGPPVGITELDVAAFDAMMGVLVRSVALGMKYAGIAMLKQGSGSIINTSSIGAWRGGGASHTYCAAKAAVSHLTRCVAIELGEAGIRVNSISPGAIVTGILPRAWGSMPTGGPGAAGAVGPVRKSAADPARRPARRYRAGGVVFGERRLEFCQWPRPGGGWRHDHGHAVLADGGRTAGICTALRTEIEGG